MFHATVSAAPVIRPSGSATRLSLQTGHLEIVNFHGKYSENQNSCRSRESVELIFLAFFVGEIVTEITLLIFLKMQYNILENMHIDCALCPIARQAGCR
jgi:hypothetical protein